MCSCSCAHEGIIHIKWEHNAVPGSQIQSLPCLSYYVFSRGLEISKFNLNFLIVIIYIKTYSREIAFNWDSKVVICFFSQLSRIVHLKIWLTSKSMISPYQRGLRHKALLSKCNKLPLHTMNQFEYCCKQFTRNSANNLPPVMQFIRLKSFS